MIAGGNHTLVSCREAAKGVPPVALSCFHSTNHTPSVRPFGLPAPPSGSRGIVRIRLRFHKTVSAYRETPQSGPLGLPAQLCIKQLYAALWSATPAKPFRGALDAPTRCPLWGKCREAAKGVLSVTLSHYHSTNDTPSVSPYGLPAPPLGSQVGGRQIQKKRGTNHGYIYQIVV